MQQNTRIFAFVMDACVGCARPCTSSYPYDMVRTVQRHATANALVEGRHEVVVHVRNLARLAETGQAAWWKGVVTGDLADVDEIAEAACCTPTTSRKPQESSWAAIRAGPRNRCGPTAKGAAAGWSTFDRVQLGIRW